MSLLYCTRQIKIRYLIIENENPTKLKIMNVKNNFCIKWIYENKSNSTPITSSIIQLCASGV